MKLRRAHWLFGMPAAVVGPVVVGTVVVGTVVVGTVVALISASVPAQAVSLPLQGEASAFLNSTLPWNYNAGPPGANRHCMPSAAHPYPVILTEGTFSSMYNSFGAISPDLVNNGYCVYAFNYGQTIPHTGFYAMGDVAASASKLSSEVKSVLSETGARKVDIVGWSLGGVMPRYYVSKLGGASKVHMLVALAPSNYGTDVHGLVSLITDYGLLGVVTTLLAATCRACVEQLHGSSFLHSLNLAPTAPGVRYVVIETKRDDVVTPYSNAFLPAGPNVRNITLQHQCAEDASDHVSIPYDSNALQDIVNALGPDDPRFEPACATVGPIFGNV
jgi:triacylglycerol esterase/lipase EstA (alpha/beta hydrolase family)